MCFKRGERGEVARGSAWAMVTGAALGIGRQYAERLALLGYNVVMVDILESVETEAMVIAEHYSVRCEAKVMDLAAVDAAHRLHEWTVAEGYRFDIVVNNAGIFSFCDIMNTPIEYGMNFKFMPELEWEYGYLWAIGLMLIVSGLTFWFFKFMKWL